MSKVGNQEESNGQERIRSNIMNLIELFYHVITKKFHYKKKDTNQVAHHNKTTNRIVKLNTTALRHNSNVLQLH